MTNTPNPQEYTLASILGEENMDTAIKSALSVWDSFVEKHPDSFINKSFLVRNICLVRKLLDTVVPNIMRNNIELETRVHELSESLETLSIKRMLEMISMASFIPTTVSCIQTLEELEAVNDRLAAYDQIYVHCGDTPENPIWLMCSNLPNETLCPTLLENEEYTQYVANNKHIKHVGLDECSLMDESEEVTNLLNELDME